MNDANWQDFLSLIQFSVAANLALFSLLPVRDHYIGNEKEVLDRIWEDLKSIKSDPKFQQLRPKWLSIKWRFRRALREDSSAFSSLNILGIIFFFIGFALLVIGSFRAQAEIQPFAQFLSLLSSFPVVCGIVYLLIRLRTYRALKLERRAFERQL